MSSLIYSAIGTQPQYRIDISKVKPGKMMVTDDPAPTAEQAARDAATSAGQQMRASLLKTMGLSEADLGKMQPETRTDLEQSMASVIHQQLSAAGSQPGAYLDVSA
ncbi:MAG: hypothetical protein AB1586_07730 [Pseudomonadota bacterium]|jgi:hypothetical protein